MPTEDIKLTLSLTAVKLRSEIAEINRMLKTSFSDFSAKELVGKQNQLKDVIGGITGAIKKTKFTDINAELRELSSVSKKAITGQEYFRKGIMRTNLQLDKMKRNIKESKPRFQSWALSLMFASMAITRTAQSLATWGVKAYDDVSHSIIGTITENDRLQGALLYLGYTIGEALQPLLGWLVPIVMGFADWVSNLSDAAKNAILFGVALTALVGIGAGLVLALGGVLGAWTKIKEVFGGVGVAKDAIDSLDGVSNAAKSANSNLSILKNALAVGALIYVGYKLFNKEKDTPYTWGDWLTNLGLAAAAGWQLSGSPYGALAAAALTLVVMLSQESVRMALERAQATKDMADKIMKGTLTAREAVANYDKLGMTSITAIPEQAVFANQNPFTKGSALYNKSQGPSVQDIISGQTTQGLVINIQNQTVNSTGIPDYLTTTIQGHR